MVEAAYAHMCHLHAPTPARVLVSWHSLRPPHAAEFVFASFCSVDSETIFSPGFQLNATISPSRSVRVPIGSVVAKNVVPIQTLGHD